MASITKSKRLIYLCVTTSSFSSVKYSPYPLTFNTWHSQTGELLFFFWRKKCSH